MSTFATPVGISKWSTLAIDADGYGDRYAPKGTQPDPTKLGSYKAKLILDPDTDGYRAFLAALETEAETLLEAERAENPAARMATEWVNLTDEYDKAESAYTGMKIIEAKKPVGFISRKTGAKNHHPLGIFDAQGAPWQPPEGSTLGNGSVLRIEVEPWLRSQGNNQYKMYFGLISVRVLHAEVYRPATAAATSVFDGTEEEESFDVPAQNEETAPF